MNTQLQKAVDLLGGQTALAKAIGVKQAHVWNWLQTKVPAEHCPDIEVATQGVVTCEALRPDVNWSVLRDSSAA